MGLVGGVPESVKKNLRISSVRFVFDILQSKINHGNLSMAVFLFLSIEGTLIDEQQ